MPVLSITMEEGTVAEWLKREGDTVARDEPLLMVEMDKGTLEVPAPASGVLRRIVVQPGTTVAVRTLIAEIGEPGEVALTPTVSQKARESESPERMFVTPRARKRERDLGIALGSLRGSGPHGRIVEADVVAAAGTTLAERAPLPMVAESTLQDGEAGVQ